MPICQKRSGLITQGEHEQYTRFRDWVYENVEKLNGALGTRYVLFGEWLLCTHGVAYDALDSYFLAFDVFDKEQERFLSTPRMEELLAAAPVVQSVPVLARTWSGAVKDLEALVQQSHFSTS